MQITRGKRAVALVVALAFFWLYVGWVHRAVSLLVALELIRCQMTPQEAKSMMETVGPVVKKTVGDVTSVMKAWTPRGKTYMTPAPNQGSLVTDAALPACLRRQANEGLFVRQVALGATDLRGPPACRTLEPQKNTRCLKPRGSEGCEYSKQRPLTSLSRALPRSPPSAATGWGSTIA